MAHIKELIGLTVPPRSCRDPRISSIHSSTLLPPHTVHDFKTEATFPPHANESRMWLNLSAIFKRLSHDANVRSIILTGAGDRAFTAGLDVKVNPSFSYANTYYLFH